MKRLGVTVLLVVIGLVAALVGGSFLALHTEPVQRKLAAVASRVLSEKTGKQVEIARIAPAFPLQFVVEGVKIEGVVEAERIAFSWRPTALFGGSLAFGYLESPAVKVLSSGGETPEITEWPSLPIGISVERLKIDRLEVDGFAVAIEGDLGIKRSGGDFGASVKITPLEKKLGTYLFELRGKAEAEDIFLHARTLPSEHDKVKRQLASAGVDVRAFNIHAFGKLDSWAAVLAGKGGSEEQQLLGDFTVVVSTDQEADTIASRLIGKRADLEGVFSIDGERILRLKPISADGERIRLRGEVVTTLGGDIHNAQVKLTVKDLSALDGIAALTYTGGVTADISLLGRAPNPTLSVEVNGESVTVSGTPISNLTAQLILHFEKEGADGTLRGSGTVGTHPVTATMDIHQKEDCWALSDFQLLSKGAQLIGQLDVCETGLVGGTLQGRVDRLLDWAPVFGTDLEGNATLDIRLDEETLTLDAVAPVLTLDQFTAEQAEIHATLHRPFSPLLGKISITAEDLFYQQLEFSHFLFSTDIEGDDWPFQTSWEDAEAEGTWSFIDKTFSATLDTFEGDIFGEAVSLKQPISVRHNETERLTFSPLSLTAGDGHLELAYTPLDEAEPIRMEAVRFPLAVLEILFPKAPLNGTVDATILLSNINSNPTGLIEVIWDGVELKDPLLLDIKSVAGRIDGELRGGMFTITVAADSEAGSPLDAHLRMPLIATGPPLHFSVPDNGKIDGHAAFSGQLGPVLQFLLPDTATVSGDLVATLDISGTAGKPEVKGDLTIDRGIFEDYYSGAIIDNIDAHFIADGPKITLERLTATDGGTGTLSATGEIALDPATDYPFNIDLIADQMLLVNLDIAQSKLGGALNFGGTLVEPKLTGALNVDSLIINLENDLPSRIPKLNTIFVNVPPSQKRKRQREHIVTIPLDVTLTSPNTTHLMGNGIKSQWGGTVRLVGTVERPELEGDLTLKQGGFELAGRQFKLTSGTIAFAGDPATRTHIQIIGSDTIEDIEINAELQGTLPNISLTFYSAPSMSAQEILSYLIFGRPASDADSDQLAQLNQASIDISKGEYSEPVWKKWQQGIGLDEFTITAPENGEEEYGILAGKKLHENFEVHVYRSINQEFNRTRIYIDLFGQFRLSGEVGNEDSERFSLVWRKNY